jgi:hypothetical protein
MKMTEQELATYNMEKPVLTNWHEISHTSIAMQFEDSYFSEGNVLALPHYFYSDSKFKDWFPNRIEVLSYVAINHPNSIVRTKACIILSRNSNGLNSCLREIEWDIDVLRQLILTDWNDIIYNITPRWCIAILNCFAEHGDQKERVVANSITMLHNILHETSRFDTEKTKATPYKANDTFINSMLRINQSLTDEVRLVTLTILDLLGSDYAWHRNRFTDIANVWKMIIEMKLTSIDSVLDSISKLYPNMDIQEIYKEDE